MYPEDWRADVEALAGQHHDLVRVLTAMRERYDGFGTEPFRVMVVLRDVLDLKPRELNLVAGWFAGNISDDELRRDVPAV
jgi:hypothetical protein